VKSPRKASPRTGKPARPAARKAAAAGKRAGASGKVAAASARKYATRADLGAPVDGFFARQPPELRSILETLRREVSAVVPDSAGTIKWGMPVYTVGGAMMCALRAHTAHVSLVLAGPPGTFADATGLLEGDGKTGKHLKLRPGDRIPRPAIRTWLRAAAAAARHSV
jgi:hypothetical protein